MKREPRPCYTTEQIAYMVAHYNIDQKAEQIAAALGIVNPDAVHKAAYRLRKRGHPVAERSGYMGDTSARVAPIGTERSGKVKTENGWQHKPTGNKRGRPALGNTPKSARKKTAPAIPTGHAGIGPHSKAEGVKTRIVQTRSNTTGRPAYSNGQNPAQVKVREQKGKWVRVDGKTWKLKAA